MKASSHRKKLGARSFRFWTNHEIKWLLENWNLYSYVGDMDFLLKTHHPNCIQSKVRELRNKGYKLNLHPHRNKYTTVQVFWNLFLTGTPYTMKALMQATGLSSRPTYAALEIFMKAKVIHIHRYVQGNGPGKFVPQYIIGEGLNAPPVKFGGSTDRNNKIRRMATHQGNPFANLIDTVTYHGNSKSQKDVHS